MSRRTAESQKAIRLAWEKEHELVKAGKGTRDWTEKQQQDILDPDKGKAYDDTGRAFEGQHMKSVEKYPKFQDNPDNIQFLTRKEHLEAHQGNWQNQTNGYYDPITKVMTEFADDELIPPKILELSDPVIQPNRIDYETKEASTESKKTKEKVAKTKAESRDRVNYKPKGKGRIKKPRITLPKNVRKAGNGIVKALKDVGRFVAEHPVETLEIVATAVAGIAELASSGYGSDGGGHTTYRPSATTKLASTSKPDIATKAVDVLDKVNRNSPGEHTVKAHGQHYGKNKVWKEKAPYQRGGK